jgi:predicted ATPase/DNA-binding winged helix-turn-helix (wHTH) protein
MSDGAVHRLSFGPFELRYEQRVLLRDGLVLPLGGRALDILSYLIERPSEVVTKKELIDHAWPDVVVEEGSLRVHIAAIRKALGDGKFGNRYIANIQGRGYSFVGAVVRLDDHRTDSPGPQYQGVLPACPCRMVGRDLILGEVLGSLREERFVTLVGPGGIGKTTIAVAAGHALAEEFDREVYFVDLGSLAHPGHVVRAIATSLGVVLKSDDENVELVDLVRSRRLLIILDSCEHVIEAAASVAERLFQGAGRVHLLATSRELLRVEGEHCHRVDPLDFPPAETDQKAEAVLRYPAVRLLVERVAAKGVGFFLSDHEARFVADMCRRLDGLPLAIELAAGPVAALGVKNAAGRLVSRLALLKLGHRTMVPRQQTLRATLDWSYNLLSDGERIALRRIASFVGDFTLEGARYVAGELGTGTEEIFDAIAGLVEKSLVATPIDSKQGTYRLLDTSRAYAFEKLEEHAEVDVVSRRHAEYVAGYLESQRSALLASSKAKRGLPNPSPSGSIRPAPEGSLRLRGDNQFATGLAVASTHSSQLGNIRSALEWSFGPNGDDEIATRLAGAATQLFLELSLLIECRLWAERAIARLGDRLKNSRRELEISTSLALALMHSEGGSEPARRAFARALDVAAVYGDSASELRILSGLFMYSHWIMDIRGATDIAVRSKKLALKTGDPDDMALAEAMLAASDHLLGNHLAAQLHCESGLRYLASGPRFRTEQYLFHYTSFLLVGMARSLLYRGLLDQSQDYAQRAREEGKKSGDPATFCRSLALVVPVFLTMGDLRRSDQYIGELSNLSAARSLILYRAIATGLRGQWLLLQNNRIDGIRLLKTALGELHAQHQEMLNMDFTCDLAAALVDLGEHVQALTLTVNAIEQQQRAGKFLHMPALFRMKGLILASRSAGDYFEAEESMLSAIDWAKRQSATLFELTAATDLAELLLEQGRMTEAHKYLRAAFDRMPAGIVSPVHKRALQILNRSRSGIKAVG